MGFEEELKELFRHPAKTIALGDTLYDAAVRLHNKYEDSERQRVKEVLEKHARRPRSECQDVRKQEENRKAEAKIKQIIEELGLDEEVR